MIMESDTPGHIAAMTAILASIYNALPTFLGILGGLAALVWYSVLFYDRFHKGGVDKAKADKEGG